MILNLTQHRLTPEQIRCGVIEPQVDDKSAIAEQLTFDSVPTVLQITDRALRLTEIAMKYKASGALIGGASYLMSKLEHVLIQQHIVPVYAFTTRRSEEKILPNGEVVKTSVFNKQANFVLSAWIFNSTGFFSADVDVVGRIIDKEISRDQSIVVFSDGRIVGYWYDGSYNGEYHYGTYCTTIICKIVSETWKEKERQRLLSIEYEKEHKQSVICPMCGLPTTLAEFDSSKQAVGVRCCSACAEGFVE